MSLEFTRTQPSHCVMPSFSVSRMPRNKTFAPLGHASKNFCCWLYSKPFLILSKSKKNSGAQPSTNGIIEHQKIQKSASTMETPDTDSGKLHSEQSSKHFMAFNFGITSQVPKFRNKCEEIDSTLQGTNISQLGKRKINENHLQKCLFGDIYIIYIIIYMLVPRRVLSCHYSELLVCGIARFCLPSASIMECNGINTCLRSDFIVTTF